MRFRSALVVTVAAVPASAVAVPSTPTIASTPEAMNGGIAWSPATFDRQCQRYEVEVTDLSAPEVRFVTVAPELLYSTFGSPAPTSAGADVLGLIDGRRYSFRVRAIDAVPAGSFGCRDITDPLAGSFSAPAGPVLFDRTPPLTTVLLRTPRITRGPVTVSIGAVDVSSPGAASGLRSVSIFGQQVNLPLGGETTVRLPEGVWRLTLVVHDRAGNAVEVTDGTVHVDQTPPVVNVEVARRSVLQGELTTFSVRSRDDGVGLDDVAPRWSFGDGGVGVGPSPAHIYRRRGVYCGTANVRDRVGNSGSGAFVMRVGRVAGAGLGQVQISGPRGAGKLASLSVCLGGRATVGIEVRDLKGRRVRRSALSVRRGAHSIPFVMPTRAGRYVVAVTVSGARRLVPLVVVR